MGTRAPSTGGCVPRRGGPPGQAVAPFRLCFDFFGGCCPLPALHPGCPGCCQGLGGGWRLGVAGGGSGLPVPGTALAANNEPSQLRALRSCPRGWVAAGGSPQGCSGWAQGVQEEGGHPPCLPWPPPKPPANAGKRPSEDFTPPPPPAHTFPALIRVGQTELEWHLGSPSAPRGPYKSPVPAGSGAGAAW